MGNALSYGILMFSIWIGGKPPVKELWCMAENNRLHGLTLIASENWIGAKHFINIGPQLESCLLDNDCLMLSKIWDSPKNLSDVFRIWWLIKNPSEVYIDSDCVLLEPLVICDSIQVPSCQKGAETIAESHGVILDMDLVKNSVGQFVEVYIIGGNGDSTPFMLWLMFWVSLYSEQGGIAETICYEPFKLSIIPPEKFKNYPSEKGIKWQKEN